MEICDGGGRPPDNKPTTIIEDYVLSAPSPVEFVSIGSDSSIDVETKNHHRGNGTLSTIKRKKHSKKHIKKTKENVESQDSLIPLGQPDDFIKPSNIVSQNSQITDSFASPSASISQTPNLPAYVPSGRQMYKPSDKGPFIVHVQKVESTSATSSFLHPVNFGRFLSKNNFGNIIDGSVQRIGRNRVSLSFSDGSSANSFIASDVVKNNNFKAFIPTFSTTRLGLVKGVPLEWTEEEILEYMRVPIEGCPIIKIRRLNYKVFVDGAPIYKPTQSCVLTFDGQILPPRVFLCFNSLAVERYYYPTVLCYQCVRFGHTKNSCRSKPRCFKCGEAHTGDSCESEEGTTSCLFCSGAHFATSKSCPEFNRQKLIKMTMAEKNISYAEANKLHSPIKGKSYADVAKTTFASVAPVSFSPTTKAPSTSYRKTVFLKPRPPPHQRHGYDHSAHQAIVSNPTISNNNGVAFNHPNIHNTSSSIIELIQALTKLLNSSSFEPSNVAQSSSSTLSHSFHDGSLSRAAMELSKSIK